MHLRVRYVLGEKEIILRNLSKLTRIEEIREEIRRCFDFGFDGDDSTTKTTTTTTLLLICMGKILDDGLRLFDYRLEDGLTVFVHLRRIKTTTTIEAAEEEDNNTSNTDTSSISRSSEASSIFELQPIPFAESDYFRVGDPIDVRDEDGTWHEAKIEAIYHHRRRQEEEDQQDQDRENRSIIDQDHDNRDEDQDQDRDEAVDLDQLVQSINDNRSVSSEDPQMDGTNNVERDGLIYHCRYERFWEETEGVLLHRIRPRAADRVNLDAVLNPASSGGGSWSESRYLVNYNMESPGEMGDWYEAEIDWGTVQKIIDDRRRRTLITTTTRNNSNNRNPFLPSYIPATLFIAASPDNSSTVLMPNCKITKLDEIYIFPERRNRPTTKFAENDDPIISSSSSSGSGIPLRTYLDCRRCMDNPSRKPTCPYCMCVVCRTDNDRSQLLVCEECAEMYHTYCLQPALPAVPRDDWYCPVCKIDHNEVIKSGQQSKKKASTEKKTETEKQQQQQQELHKRCWGGRQSCDGVSKKCTLVPVDHFGPIPGVEVGTRWRYRKQVSEAGVHRPLVCGIHGRTSEGAYSIVLAGGYEDDQDHGDVIVFTGSGGRDLSGNKRVSKQSKDQTLDKNNAALARNCYCSSSKKKQHNASGKFASLNLEGSDAGADWARGKPVRVVRSWKLRNEYAPKEGLRYDGIYKVSKYWPQKGKHGHVVWQFQLRRDDPTPAPWTAKGKALVKKRGLERIIEDQQDNVGEPVGKRAKKTAATVESDCDGPPPIAASYSIGTVQLGLIAEDTRNAGQWKDCLSEAGKGPAAFFNKLADTFTCAICQHVVHRPAILDCGHSHCIDCVVRSARFGYDQCPSCRRPIAVQKQQNKNSGGGSAEEYGIQINQELAQALEALMPGYAKGRGGGGGGKKKQK